MARGKGKNPQWIYKDGDRKHPHFLRDCAYCGEEYLARVDSNSRFCSLSCAGKANNPSKSVSDREDYLRCVKCGKEKPFAEFSKCAKNATGHKSRCKACRADDWQGTKTPEIMERMRLQGVIYDAEHKDERRAYRKQWREDNREKVREGERRRRARVAAVTIVDFPDELIESKKAYWGWRCWICGSPEIAHMDHVKPIKAGGAHMLANLRPTCQPCNNRKWAKWPFPTTTQYGDPFELYESARARQLPEWPKNSKRE